MKTIVYIFSCLLLFTTVSCEDFLEIKPKGVLSEEDVINADNVDGFITSAYAALGNDHYDTPFSLWPYGNVRADDAYKGGSGTNDIQAFHFFEISNNIRTDFAELDKLWYNYYVGISRANKAIAALNQITEQEFPQKKSRLGEMHFLRGHFYFMLKIMFKNIPYVTEDTVPEEYGLVSNRALTDDQLWENIATDFEFAANNTPPTQSQVGRVNQYAAYAYLAKTRLYQAYEQDEDYNVTNINQQTLQKVINATDQVIGTYSLEADFGFNFLPGSYENGSESVFAVQYSDNDGTLHGRLNFGDVLSVPQGLGCCDFHKPSQNLVNAFKTTADGLPMFDTFNDTDLDYNQLNSFDVDPRLYHTVAIPGLPFKYAEDYIYEESWNRSPGTYGYFASLKENVQPDCGCFVNIDPFYGNSKNRILIRYADVLLIRAEALIEMGQHNDALPIINQIRARAAASTTLTSSYTSNNLISQYEDGVNCVWSQDFARKALRWERRLEFAMEGYRFFDLVRWGVASETLNAYYAEEKTKRGYYLDAGFDKNKEEFCPIPLAQINFSQGLYKQNKRY
ncbi:RagB/SusD family nutrient uptake outer membrane protein [Wenyingzhuangia marina]|uniref:Starch-binding associating with outer membrane n=1 Tax=Wenyingzhuangia marina TaxID=1195760 RepID=A0A1M5VCZ0_9FLAO|nr:RagB/SusD family nutrient uptake outer membrane protein [Wenyingzhuangia marina]GGF73085.1 glycan metabolism protein RagB [Wenyingzhuangia marina]SHH72783.1 Starch-binding associating with outer membrane [Wenyingzhuangia marina]